MKTTSKYKIIISGGAILLLPFFAYAQTSAPSNQQPAGYDEDGGLSCTVCGTTPSQIEDFIILTTDILGVLSTKYTAGTQAGQYKVFGPRQGGLYGSILSDNSNNPSIYKNIVDGTLRNLDQKQSAIRTTAVLLGMYGGDIISDGALGFAVVAQPWPMVRDYQRLLDIDTMLSDKVYELGLAGGYSRTIDTETINAIREAMDKEVGGEKIFNDVRIEDSMKAKDILQIISKLNKKHKNLIVLGSKTKSDTAEDLTKDNNSIVIDLNEGYWTKLKEDYSCARLGTKGKMQCSNQFSKFRTSIKNITKNFIEKGPKQSLEKIKVASRRLKTRGQQIAGNTNNDFYKKNITDYENREAELLSIQGVERRKTPGLSGIISENITRSILGTLQEGKMKAPSIINSIKDEINKYKPQKAESDPDKQQPTSLAIAGVKEDIQGKKANEQQTPNIVSQAVSTIKDFFGGNKESEITKKIKANVINNLENTIADHAKQIKLQSIASTDDSIDKLTNILTRIRFLNLMIYDPGNQQTLYENIVRTCELQCSNLGGTCR